MPSTIKMQTREEKEYKPWKAGLYQVVVDDVKDKIVEEESKYNKIGDELYTFVFRILKKGDQNDRLIWKDWVKPFISAPKKGRSGSNLYSIVKAIFPELGDLDLYGKEDVNELIGKQLILSIKPQEDDQWCKITDYIPADKEMKVPKKEEKEEVSPDDLPF